MEKKLLDKNAAAAEKHERSYARKQTFFILVRKLKRSFAVLTPPRAPWTSLIVWKPLVPGPFCFCIAFLSTSTHHMTGTKHKLTTRDAHVQTTRSSLFCCTTSLSHFTRKQKKKNTKKNRAIDRIKDYYVLLVTNPRDKLDRRHLVGVCGDLKTFFVVVVIFISVLLICRWRC